MSKSKQTPLKDWQLLLWGGEPLLYPDLIEEVLAQFPKNKVHIISNGTQYSNQIKKIFNKANKRLRLQISIDGRPNQERSKTEALIIKNALKFKKFANLRIRGTLTKQRIHSLFADTVFLCENFGKVTQRFLDEKYLYDKHDILALDEQLSLLVPWYIEQLAQGKKYVIDLLFGYAKFRHRQGCFSPAFCSAGISEFYIDTDGTFYPCLRLAGTGNFAIGSLKEGFTTKLREFQKINNVNTLKNCTTCTYNQFCNLYENVCLACNYQHSQAWNQIEKQSCAITFILFKHAQKFYQQIKQKNILLN